MTESLRRSAKHDEVVYLMQFGEGCPVKVGYTSNIGLRLEVIGASHWRPMSLLYVVAGNRRLEGQLHRRWTRHRIGSTEWFSPAPEILAWWEEQRAREPTLEVQLARSLRLMRGVDLDTIFGGTHSSRLKSARHT